MTESNENTPSNLAEAPTGGGVGLDAAPCYTVTLTREQMQVVESACNILSRLGMGQMMDAMRALPLKEDADWEQWHASCDSVKRLMGLHMVEGCQGLGASLGMANDKVPYQAKLACDIHQTIRRHQAWERAVEDGIIVSMASERKWPEMMYVQYNKPTKYTDQPLPEISKHND